MVTRRLELGSDDIERWDHVVAEAGGDAAVVLRRQFDRFERRKDVARYRWIKELDARLTREGKPADPDPRLRPREPFVERQVSLTPEEAERLDYFVRELVDGDVPRLMHLVLIGQDKMTRLRDFERLHARGWELARRHGVMTEEESQEHVRRVLNPPPPELDRDA
jgi:hypothetical protein